MSGNMQAGRVMRRCVTVLACGCALTMIDGATAPVSVWGTVPASVASRTAALASVVSRPAVASRVITLHESASLHVTRSSGSYIEAHGKASGTLNGSLYIHIVVNSAERMSASLTGSAHSGTITGHGTSRYRVSGNNSYYSGTVSISGGTGTYAHAHANDIHIEGVMNRIRRTITMTIGGKLYV